MMDKFKLYILAPQSYMDLMGMAVWYRDKNGMQNFMSEVTISENIYKCMERRD
jgi:hypothetical protein